MGEGMPAVVGEGILAQVTRPRGPQPLAERGVALGCPRVMRLLVHGVSATLDFPSGAAGLWHPGRDLESSLELRDGRGSHISSSWWHKRISGREGLGILGTSSSSVTLLKRRALSGPKRGGCVS